MKYKLLFPLMLATLPLSAMAQTTRQELVEEMAAGGFRLVEVRRSWLGREILDFEDETREREIIFAPATGVIIRDYTEPRHDEDDRDGWFWWLGFGHHDGDAGEHAPISNEGAEE